MSESKKPGKESDRVPDTKHDKALDPKPDEGYKPPTPSVSDSRPPPKRPEKPPEIDIDKIDRDWIKTDIDIEDKPTIDNTRPVPRPGGKFKIDE